MQVDVSAIDAMARQYGTTLNEAFDAIERALFLAYTKDVPAGPGARAWIDDATGDVWILDANNEDVTPDTFRRTGAAAARQAVIAWIRDVQRRVALGSWADTEGDVIFGTVRSDVYRNEKGITVFTLTGGAEGVMPSGEAVEGEDYTHGKQFSVLILAANVTDKGKVRITVSRRQPALISSLFSDAPEIQDGSVEVLGVAREAGVRSKIAVSGENAQNIVGVQGERARRVAREAGGEKIDVVVWPGTQEGFVAAALSPGKVKRVEVEGHDAKVYADEEQISLILGQGGRNARLASKLTGLNINVVAE